MKKKNCIILTIFILFLLTFITLCIVFKSQKDQIIKLIEKVVNETIAKNDIVSFFIFFGINCFFNIMICPCYPLFNMLAGFFIKGK